MLALTALLYALLSFTNANFVLHDAPNAPQQTTLQASALGKLQCRRMGTLVRDVAGSVSSDDAAWNAIEVNAFQLPQRSITLIVSGLTKSDAATLALAPHAPRHTAPLHFYHSSNPYRDILASHPTTTSSPTTTTSSPTTDSLSGTGSAFSPVVLTAAPHCDAANALMHAVDSPRAFCETSGRIDILTSRLSSVVALPLSVTCDEATETCDVRLDAAQDSVTFSRALLRSFLRELVLFVDAAQQSDKEMQLGNTASILAAVDTLSMFDADSSQRKLAVQLLGAVLEVVQCNSDNTICAIASMDEKTHSKRAVEALKLNTSTTKAYTFHLFLWIVILFILLFYSAAYCMNSMAADTSKDPLLFRNTTSTMFDNALELQLR